VYTSNLDQNTHTATVTVIIGADTNPIYIFDGAKFNVNVMFVCRNIEDMALKIVDYGYYSAYGEAMYQLGSAYLYVGHVAATHPYGTWTVSAATEIIPPFNYLTDAVGYVATMLLVSCVDVKYIMSVHKTKYGKTVFFSEVNGTLVAAVAAPFAKGMLLQVRVEPVYRV
jgi:hypothetical protein